ncbi:MAG: triose-phosphate isomerase [Bacteroidetes bacterium CG18_big_fil_WC_8_21_14_2_50_41_14]|nr:MAG: triose-phosphate isomerase [Bacteroidetes bacterium CG18_big_fil_WC_8_21_14_2_50_41_14]PJB59975.1 MAG: triose-phosphate isomerase [Bacteroidetes bacterium CG_4_9_14_3_um_filter_41_19]
MRKKIVAGNWKMNKSFQDAEDLVSTIADELDGVDTACEVVLCPPFPYLEMASDYADESGLQIAAQNVSEFENGAYTGEVSASMLASIEIGYCIVGHSERRKYFGETNAQLAVKVEKLLDHAIRPIFCIGELLEERNANNHFEVVKRQLEEGLFNLNKDEFSVVVIAYEPVWAIGTGVTATSAQAQEMHAFIREQIAGKYGKPVADQTTILYGGSCNAKNAAELFANPDVDGGLIGGASLVAEDFIKIVKSF